jgi:hypothetical protein
VKRELAGIARVHCRRTILTCAWSITWRWIEI